MQGRFLTSGEHEALLSALPLLAACVLDADGRLARQSPALERELGFSARELAGAQFLELLHPDDRERAAAAIEKLRVAAAQAASFESRCRCRDGSYKWLSWTLAPADGQGLIAGAAQDVSRQKLLEKEFLQSQKMEAVGRLASGIAHDFNNLLTAILGHCDLLLEEMDCADARRAEVQHIRASGERAAGLTRQLLVYSRREAAVLRPVDLNAVVVDLEKMLRRVIGEDVAFVTRLDPGIGLVNADPGQIEQVVVNLAVNARDAMPQGGELRIETARVELGEECVGPHCALGPGSYAALLVCDSGSGMGPDVRARLFEPFFTTKAPGKGTGLGLSTVLGIVRESGGGISVQSEPGRGTTFKIYFPSGSV